PERIRFTTSFGAGSHQGSGTLTMVGFGYSGSCDNGAPTANINLVGTPFFVSNTIQFELVGSRSVQPVFSPDRKVVTITGGGACGWVRVPSTFTPLQLDTTFTGGNHLLLKARKDDNLFFS